MLDDSLLQTNEWKDRIMGDLKNFSDKKYKPVGMHHLIDDIKKYISKNHIIDFSFSPIVFKNGRKLEKPQWIKKISKEISKGSDKIFGNPKTIKNSLKTAIVYYIPIPKTVFSLEINSIKNYFNFIKEQEKNIEYMIIRALEKYGYKGVGRLNSEKILGKTNIGAMFEQSNLGVLAPNGFPVTDKYGPRVYVSYVVTDAPLKSSKDYPTVLKSKMDNINIDLTKHIKYYFKSFGLYKTLFDSVQNALLDNKFGEFINFCYQSQIGKEFEINLMVKDPLDYKK